MLNKKDEIILLNILDCINKILSNTASFRSAEVFQKDNLRFDATLMNFIVIGEMVGKLSEEIKSNYNKIEWNKMYAFRNILVHDYFGVYEVEVWQIIQNDIPVLKNKIELLLK